MVLLVQSSTDRRYTFTISTRYRIKSAKITFQVDLSYPTKLPLFRDAIRKITLHNCLTEKGVSFAPPWTRKTTQGDGGTDRKEDNEEVEYYRRWRRATFGDETDTDEKLSLPCHLPGKHEIYYSLDSLLSGVEVCSGTIKIRCELNKGSWKGVEVGRSRVELEIEEISAETVEEIVDERGNSDEPTPYTDPLSTKIAAGGMLAATLIIWIAFWSLYFLSLL